MRKILGLSALSAVFVISSAVPSLHAASIAPQYGPPPGPPPQYDQHGDWEGPPREFDEVSRRGFHDGIEGARKDAGNNRRPDVRNRDEYRHPDLPHRDRRAYRRAFERGYQVGVQHFYNRR